MKTCHTVFFGDARSMDSVSDGSVHLIVTSPPYWQLKDYSHRHQIGFDDTYEEYINNLNLVWSECYRVLHPGCRLCINIGDQFARAVYYGRYKVIPIRTEIIRFCETIGLDYMGAVIWQKVTTTNTTGGGAVMGSYPHPRNGILKIDYEFILIFKKAGKGPSPTVAQKQESKMTPEEWNEYFSGHWNFPGERQRQHIAMFPEELPRRLIKMFTFSGETVLDPFLGSGTTSQAAMNLNRNSIGYEVNTQFKSIIRKKCSTYGEDSSLFFSKVMKPLKPVKRKIEALPYVFKDAVKLNIKESHRTSRYGSKISGSEKSIQTYYRVVDIKSSVLIELKNGILVRLLGLTPVKANNGSAIDFLTRALKGKKIVLVPEPDPLVSGLPHSAYIYLKNKTFINAHLLKKGFARPDRSNHRLKEKFLQLASNHEHSSST
jgi:site-specific DNA-methyltransferase (adenine-specific)